MSRNLAPFISGGLLPPSAFLAGLLWELDPAKATVSSGRIIDWGGGFAAQADTTRQAAFVSSDAKFNGQPSADFDPVGIPLPAIQARYYDLPSLVSLTQGETFLVVSNRYGNPPNFSTNWPTEKMTGLWFYGSSPNNNHVPYTDNNWYEGFGRTNRLTCTGAGPSEWFEAVPTLLNLYVEPTGPKCTYVANSLPFTQTGGFAIDFVANPRFGAGSTALYGFSGWVAYHCMCSQVQTPTARAQMKEYLSTRFATSGYWT